jgi:hypothetical protein
MQSVCYYFFLLPIPLERVCIKMYEALSVGKFENLVLIPLFSVD